MVFANLRSLGVQPSPICDDSTFLRRVTLDIAGRLPTEAETTAFLASQEPNKRDTTIEALLRTPDYADFFANKWTALLKNRRDDASDLKSNFAFHAWMRDSLLANKPYDQIVRELLGATGTVIANPAVAWYKRVKEPKEQLEDVAQLFLVFACSAPNVIITRSNVGVRMITTAWPHSSLKLAENPRTHAAKI